MKYEEYQAKAKQNINPAGFAGTSVGPGGYKRTPTIQPQGSESFLYNNITRNLLGSPLGVLGFIGANTDPLQGLERSIGYGKEYGKSMLGTMSRYSIPGMAYQLGKSGLDLSRGSQQLARRDIPGAQKTIDNLKRQAGLYKENVGTDIANAVDIAGTIVGASGAIGAVKGVGKEIVKGGLKKGLLTVAESGPKGNLLTKLGKVGQGIKVTKDWLGTPLRTGAGKLIGKLGEGAITAGWGASAGAAIRGGDASNKIEQTKLIKEGGLRTATQLAWAGVTDIPYIAKGLESLTSNSKKIKEYSGLQSLNKAIDSVFGTDKKASALLNKEFKVPKRLGGGTYTNKQALADDVIRWVKDNEGVELKNIRSQDLIRFMRDQKLKGNWTDDIMQNLGYNTRYLQAGPNNLKPLLQGIKGGDKIWDAVRNGNADEVLRLTDSVKNKEVKGALSGYIEEMLNSDVGKNGEYIGKWVGKTKKMTQAGTTFDFAERVSAPQLTSIQKGMASVLTKVRESKVGKVFTEKIETASIMKDIDQITQVNLQKKIGSKAKNVVRDLQTMVEESTNKAIPIATIENLPSKDIRLVMQKHGVTMQVSEFKKMLSGSYDQALKENNIFSIKSKIGKNLPVFNQMNRAYMGGRFGLKPSFWAMQWGETYAKAPLVRSQMKSPLAQKYFSEIFAHAEFGNKAKKLLASVEGIDKNSLDLIERTSPNFEVVKRMKAQSAFFIDDFVKEVNKTPLGKTVIGKKVITDFSKGLEKADDKVEFIQKFITANKTKVSGQVALGDINSTIDKLKAITEHASSVAAKSSQNKASFVPLYKSARTAAERMTHNVAFPFSYIKSMGGESLKFMTTGKSIRPQIGYQVAKTFTETRQKIEDKAVTDPRWRPVLHWMSVFDPTSSEFPISPGGPTPMVRFVDDFARNPGKYKDPTAVMRAISPAIKEWYKIYGEGMNLAGKEEPWQSRGFYPKYLEQNREMQKGKIKAFQKYQ
jgi:hypothetical protein